MPGNSALTIPGRLGKNTKVPSGTPCLVDTAVVNNLLQGISINHCLAHPEGSVVPVIVIIQNNHNVWIQQPLLTAKFLDGTFLMGLWCKIPSGGEQNRGGILPLPMADIMASLKMVHNEPDQVPSKEEASPESHPHLDPIPTPKWPILIFKKK